MLLYLLLVPIASFAISLNKLQNTPSKYVKVGTTQEWDVYVVDDSTQVLRESPPYYTLGCKAYLIYYKEFSILDFSLIVNYDYKRSGRTIAKTIALRHKDDETKNIEQIKKEIERELTSPDIGMKSTITMYGVYAFDGQLELGTQEGYVGEKNRLVQWGSAEYIIANYLFNKYYHERFL